MVREIDAVDESAALEAAWVEWDRQYGSNKRPACPECRIAVLDQ